jgi:hypothetical protein
LTSVFHAGDIDGVPGKAWTIVAEGLDAQARASVATD